jgi:pSer/pThr/pTyr-binding forkhead associated (FHA) protein
LVVVKAKGLKRGERYDLFGGLSIGRSDEAEIRISDKFSSGLHARLYSRAGSWIVQDLDSTNGTMLNGDELQGESEVLDGDVIEIGDTKFRIELG